MADTEIYIIRSGLPHLLKTDLTVIRTREFCLLNPRPFHCTIDSIARVNSIAYEVKAKH